MIITKKAINQFRRICRNEENSSDDLIRYKIKRDFLLGIHLATPYEDMYKVAYGTLRIKMVGNTVVKVYRGRKRYPVNSYAKHRYNTLLKPNKENKTAWEKL